MAHTLSFTSISQKDINTVGGKNASLGEMINHLTQIGIKVPEGFAITTDAYFYFLSQNNLKDKINTILKSININKFSDLKIKSQKIQKLILKAELPKDLKDAILKAYHQLGNGKKLSVAVRSSAIAEDLPEASFAGQQDTYLNISGEKNLLEAIKKVFASLFTSRAISYRARHQVSEEKVGISVGVQRMVRSDKAVSGVIFTLDTESGFDQAIFITASYGLGEAIVQGLVNPDEFYVFKPSLKNNKSGILKRNLGHKQLKMIYNKNQKGVKIIKVPKQDQTKLCLTDQEVENLAKQAILIEKHYGMPMDIEWAKDGKNGALYIVQARPETVKARSEKQFVERFILEKHSKIKTQGRSVGQKIGQGKAHLIKNIKKANGFQKGDVLVTDMTDPDWEPLMKIASAIVTNRGGRTCHAAIVARELGIPAVVGCGNATQMIKEKEEVTVSCIEGEVGYVYQGILPFKQNKIDTQKMPKLPVKLCMNLGNPQKAFDYQFLPNDGVGLARLEFIIGNTIGIHPEALLKYKKIPSHLKKEIKKKISAYSSPKEFYIQKLAEGIATIAAAFYPKEVIFRFSDFKSNEYANLLGGKLFEPEEENPMIGFRGASRYIADNFSECFALECEAFKRVREKMGLVNAQVMVPFVRTVNELKESIEWIESLGLKRGENGLKIYMMCEIPSNALLAEQFLHYCDGFSIGSNDLTQLTLGLDRDSALIANLFDERNEAVKALLKMAIDACNKAGKYIGICGQAPSDYPEIAKWLLEQGIQSISLTPDTIVDTWLYLGKE